MVTVPLDAGTEAVVALDNVTCDLTGYVPDRFSGKFFVQYRYNVAQDFPISRASCRGSCSLPESYLSPVDWQRENRRRGRLRSSDLATHRFSL